MAYPPEFRRDVVAVARQHEAPLFRIAKKPAPDAVEAIPKDRL